MRTRTSASSGHACDVRPRWASAAAATASRAPRNTQNVESPCVSTSSPLWRLNAARRISWWCDITPA